MEGTIVSIDDNYENLTMSSVARGPQRSVLAYEILKSQDFQHGFPDFSYDF